ncbi:MAG: hypothetical protein KC910_03190 [Candidatus Eremiobacteraeota bacterium]|nr:hypothetical protein [Candidatus Eremiobacteraeota bacterium]
MKQTSLVLMVALLLVLPALAQDYDASGVWRSTTGNTFTIPPSDTDFDIYINTTDGRKLHATGEWDEVGYSFYYTVDGMSGAAYVEYDADQDALSVTSHEGVQSWWRRVEY